jgi:hypothetical protein
MTTTLQQLTASQANKEVAVNRNFETLSALGVYGKKQSTSAGLTWGYYGGRWSGFSVADGTHTLTNASDNYIVAKRSDGVTSVSTATTNWTNTTDYARCYKVTTAGSVVTATEDHRAGLYGAHGSAVAPSGTFQPLDSDLTTIAGLTATTDNFMQAKSSAWASRTVAQVTTDLQATGLVTDAVGFRTIPSNSQSAAYTTVAADSGKSIDHPSTDANARTFTIDSNANVAYPVGTCITFTNMTANVVTIAITSDTMYLAGAGTTGSRSLAQYGIATARKLTSTTWLISGTGLT